MSTQQQLQLRHGQGESGFKHAQACQDRPLLAATQKGSMLVYAPELFSCQARMQVLVAGSAKLPAAGYD